MEGEKKLVSIEDFGNERKRLFDIVRRQRNAIDLFKRNIDDKNVEKERHKGGSQSLGAPLSVNSLCTQPPS